VKSEAKAQKENGMFDQFSERFEEGLRGIANSLSKKNGTKKIDKVHERIGRLKEKYSSIHQCYKITVTPDDNGNASSLSFEKNEEHPKITSAGIYFLRTSLNGTDEKTLWTIYNAIREIEYTFRVLKGADSRQVRESVERLYGVHVTSVRIIKMHEKKRRRGLTEGVKKGYKKAVVALRQGEAIDIF